MKGYILRLKQEFKGYNQQTLIKDLLAGLTVAAVALPLALAFGVSSGADGAAGLITAIIAGLMIGTLSGASYQISGPTGAMSAILISLSQLYGLQGVFIASFLSGVILLIASIFKFGKVVSFIPGSVIAGFTSGIAILIFTQQINNFFGVTSEGSTTLEKIASYFDGRFTPHMTTMLIGLAVVIFMIVYPKKWNQIIPSSLCSIVLMLGINLIFHLDVAIVGEIPSTLLPEVRLDLFAIPWTQISKFIIPALSIAALGMIESLLCGASAGKMKDEKLDADQELFAQGVGNMIIPFFGGVPATAAIARTSVAIKAGGQTRMTSVFHSVVLLLAMFLLGPWMAKIPLAALAGVLMVTAWRMNDWKQIGQLFHNRIKTPIFQFMITMLSTVIFDLTVAIVLGVFVSMILFVMNSAQLNLVVSDVDLDKMAGLKHHHRNTKVVYITGPLFFANQGQLMKVITKLIAQDVEAIVLSIRGVPSIDDSGLEEWLEIYQLCQNADVELVFSGAQKTIEHTLDRNHVYSRLPKSLFYWSTMEALYYLDEQCAQI